MRNINSWLSKLPRINRPHFGFYLAFTSVFGVVTSAYLLKNFKAQENKGEIPMRHTISLFPPASNATFRGTIAEYNKLDPQKLKSFSRIEIMGESLGSNAYDPSTLTIDETTLFNFMRKANSHQVKEISFLGATLTPDCGLVLKLTLNEAGASVKTLEVTANQLEKTGMLALLQGLKVNKTLETLYCRSYNCQSYDWSEEEVTLLAEVLAQHPTLKEIALPHNDLTEGKHITLLANVYRNHKDPHHKLASISGLSLRGSSIPDFNANSVDENDICVMSQWKFR